MSAQTIALNPRHPFQAKQLERESGIPISRCYQCLKCSNGCPVVRFMDFMPHEVIRYIQWGQAQRILHAGTMWVCSTCATCATRCPNGIDVTGFMNFLKNKIFEMGLPPKDRQVAAFHKAFVSGLLQQGHNNELLLMARYFLKRRNFLERLRNGSLISELSLGWHLFRKGRIKISFRPHAGAAGIRTLYQGRRKES